MILQTLQAYELFKPNAMYGLNFKIRITNHLAKQKKGTQKLIDLDKKKRYVLYIYTCIKYLCNAVDLVKNKQINQDF